MSEGPPQFRRWEAIALVIVLTVGLVPLTAILGLGNVVPMIAISGFVLLPPLIAILGDRLPYVESGDDDTVEVPRSELETDATGSHADREDPVAKLRDRYARGEIDDAEFEHRLERLLETEDLQGVVERGAADRPASSRDLSTELE